MIEKIIGGWFIAAFIAYCGFRWACKKRAEAECREWGHDWKSKEEGGLYCWNCMKEID